jgi:dTDP-4-amino-4,6-dideoxygalactose transaminase
MIPFNKPYYTGNEIDNISKIINTEGHLSGNGLFSKQCQSFFEENYKLKKALLTTSCTDALEMTAMLLNIKEGDEIIMPSYTFVSTANAFVRQGAKIIFADSKKDHPNIDENKIEELITIKTKAIVVVHYAGMACEMDKIMSIAKKHNLFVIEDAAQAIDAFYKNIPLGTIGNFGTFSFHETKNIQCGEGGLLSVNDDDFINRAEIIWEKGTNRSSFFRGEVNKYEWVDVGSSFLPSELNAAFLLAQLNELKYIQKRRVEIWDYYYSKLKILEEKNIIQLPIIPNYSTNNAHTFYIICKSLNERQSLIEYLKKYNIHSVFHYLTLHNSSFYKDKHDGRELKNATKFENTLLRLPLYNSLSDRDVDLIVSKIHEYFSLK